MRYGETALAFFDPDFHSGKEVAISQIFPHFEGQKYIIG